MTHAGWGLTNGGGERGVYRGRAGTAAGGIAVGLPVCAHGWCKGVGGWHMGRGREGRENG